MNKEFKHLPAILLVDSCQKGILPTREWLEQSRFRTWEALNVFEALEGISDFTLRNRPDVILVNVDSITRDFELLSELLLHDAADGLEYPVFALSCQDHCKSVNVFEGDLDQINEKLEELVPIVSRRSPKTYTKSV